jgi:hypothetical protein
MSVTHVVGISLMKVLSSLQREHSQEQQEAARVVCGPFWFSFLGEDVVSIIETLKAFLGCRRSVD